MGDVHQIRLDDGLDELVDAGARLIPLKGKQPVKKGWTEAKHYRAQTVREWLKKGQNVGMVTGKDSGVVVIDVDPRNGGERSLYDLQDVIGKLPDTRTVATGGGGLHLYFKWYAGASSRKPFDGIDFQADKRCVVIPPSVHPETGALYRWENSNEIAQLPDPWRDAMNGGTSKPAGFIDDGHPIPEGKRNETLFKIARSLYQGGAGEREVLHRLSEINMERCVSPLDVSEVDSIARNAYRYKSTKQSHLTHWQQTLMRSDISRREKLIGFTLSTYADTEGRNCFPSQDRIASACQYQRQRISESTALLESEGWIKRIPVSRQGKHGWNYNYVLTVPDVRLPDNE